MRLKSDTALFEQAIAHHRVGKLREAARLYQEVVRLRPDHAAAHANLGVALKDRGNSDDAVTFYRRLLQLKPDLYEAQSNLLYANNLFTAQLPGGPTCWRT